MTFKQMTPDQRVQHRIKNFNASQAAAQNVLQHKPYLARAVKNCKQIAKRMT